MLARPEILSGEILASEIAADALGVSVEVEFHGAGATAFYPVASSVANTVAQVAGTATVEGRLQAVVEAKFSAVGTGNVAAISQPRFVSSFEGTGESVVLAEGSTALPVAFDAQGSSVAEFKSLDGPGFDIQGATHVEFLSSASAEVTFAIEGRATGDIHPQLVVGTRAVSSSTGVLDAHGIGVTNTTGGLEGTSETLGVGVAEVNATAQSQGSTQLVVVGDSVASTEFAATGGTGVDFDASPYTRANTVATLAGGSMVSFHANPQINVWAQFVAQGHTAADMEVSASRQAIFQAFGSTQVDFRRGREVQPYLVASPDATERPEENRVAEWR